MDIEKKINDMVAIAMQDANEICSSGYKNSEIPSFECIAKTKEICTAVYTTHKLLPERIAYSVENGLMISYALECIGLKKNEWVMYIETYNDLDTCCLVNNNLKRKILPSSMIATKNITELVNHISKYHQPFNIEKPLLTIGGEY